ncbi:MAG TPA: beta-N-acetylhexosaminidase [Opitutales bacterium]|nr:beta-N-acetylhexosaminidase [Opitutales bacterium]
MQRAKCKVLVAGIAAGGICIAGECAALRPFPEFSAPRAITQGPHDHFFANYFAINAWSPDNRYTLVLETDIKDKLPDGAPCTLGLVDTQDGNRFIPVTTTRCWNFQEAAMAHWMPCEKDTFVFNDLRDGKFCTVVMNWKTKTERVYPFPVSAVNEDGTWAVSINYARLFLTRPDYGYSGEGQGPRRGVVFPEDDGLWAVNLKTGEAKLIVSCAAVKNMVPAVKSKDGMSYLCHTVISKDGKRIYFLSRSVEESFEGVKKFKGVKWETTAFTCNADGSDIRRCFPDGWGSSHFNWKPNLSERDARTMIVTANFQLRGYTHVEFTVGEENRARQVGGKEMDFDGHCIYTPDGKFISGDGYWDKDFYRHWKMVRLEDEAIVDLGRYFIPEVYRDVYCRCDLHPRWRPDGLQIGFNSVHEGTRQVYVMDVLKNPPVPRPALVPMPREIEWKAGKCPCDAAVREVRDERIPAEGYRLEVSADGIAVASSDSAGAFYARQTLRQLEWKDQTGAPCYPCCGIVDSPAYGWRAMLIDEGRHFLGKETVKQVVDLISMHKYNRLHWHLTEDQGWRIDVPGMSELAKYGSVRAESPKHGSVLKHLGGFNYESELNGQQYGPFFYTRADLEEIVAYARDRHVEIVPEIELPGHSMGALAAYPELACFPEAIKPRMAYSDWGIATNVLCIGNDRTLRFLEKVMDYVCEVFPSQVIHIGGDECPRVAWQRCPKCQARMKAEGLRNEGQLQEWITRKMAEYLAKKGRRIMGWDEILNGDVPKTAIGQSWRTQAKEGAGTEHVSAAAGALRGFDMVMSPHSECYYTYFSGLQDDPFQYSTPTAITLRRAYRFDPMTGVPESARSHVLGAEACCWGEYTWNEYDLMWKMWPRACAMAEILWTNPKDRDFEDFRERVKSHRRRLVRMHVNCQPVD